MFVVDGTEGTGGVTVGGSIDTTNRWSSGNSKVYNTANGYGVPSWSTTATVLEIDGTEATAGTATSSTSLVWDNSVANATNLTSIGGSYEAVQKRGDKIVFGDGSRNPNIRLFDATTNTELWSYDDDSFSDGINSPEKLGIGDNYVAFVNIRGNGNQGEVQILDINTGARVSTISYPSSHVKGLIVLPNGKLITYGVYAPNYLGQYDLTDPANPVLDWSVSTNPSAYAYGGFAGIEMGQVQGNNSLIAVPANGDPWDGGDTVDNNDPTKRSNGRVYLVDTTDGSVRSSVGDPNTPDAQGSNMFRYVGGITSTNKLYVGAPSTDNDQVYEKNAGRIHVYDVSDPDNPSFVKSLAPSDFGYGDTGTNMYSRSLGDQHTKLVGDYLFAPIATGSGTTPDVLVIDTSDDSLVATLDVSSLGTYPGYPRDAGNAVILRIGPPWTNNFLLPAEEVAGPSIVGGSVDTTNRWSSGNSKVYNTANGYGVPSWSTTATVLEIDGTEATAGTGEPIIAVNSKIVVGVNNNDDAGNNSGSVYVYDLDGTNEVKITASDAAANDNFGRSVAAGHGKIVVGAYNDDDGGTNSGSVYVYDLDGTNEVKITASDARPNTNFGWSTAVGESKIVVGAYGMSPQSHFDAGNTGGGYHGAVYVYDLDGSNEVKITASDAAASDQFGYSVAVGSNKIAVATRLDDDNGDNSGSVYVYDLDGSNEVKITASDAAAGDQFGWSVAIGNDKIVVGARYKDSELGAVYVYDLDGSNEVKITASDRNSLTAAAFGASVAVGENKIAVGSSYAPSSSNNIGAVYVYDLDGSNEVKITASDGTTGAGFGDAFGHGVGIADGKVIASAIGRDANGNVDSGAIYVYDLDGSNEIKFSASDADSNDYGGMSIAVGSITTSTAGSVVGGSVDTTDRWSSGNSKVYNTANGYGVPSWNTTATVIDE